MMKNHGYRKDMAGAIEAVASTSGQIMPPILGLAGFIIALFLNVPYMKSHSLHDSGATVFEAELLSVSLSALNMKN